MRTCDDPSIPCHRVTGANGALGGYGSSPLLKRQLLIAEGVTLRGGRLREFARIRWTGRG
jgi:alkylated DNA nucleotide flippase Atl1